jgi:hypothetical protein
MLFILLWFSKIRKWSIYLYHILSSTSRFQSGVAEATLLWVDADSNFPFLNVPYVPELQDDFHLSVLDWSTQNAIRMGLGRSVYIYYAYIRQAVGLCDVSWGGSFVISIACNEQVSDVTFSLF